MRHLSLCAAQRRCRVDNIKTRPCVGDIFVLVLCLGLFLCATAYFFIPNTSADTGTARVVIATPDGETYYPLDTPRTVSIVSRGISLTVKIENGEVCVASSDCPDGLCVNTGRISRSGRAVVCVPAQVSVKIENGEAYDADFIIG